jgi:CDP-diacylglycerol--serine O-phosphatidyltransferase
MGNLLLGFLAVIRGLSGAFQHAALAIFVAVILDALDGKIARLTRTESDFGREFDSLADVSTFGFAPAVLAYIWGLEELGRLGWLVPAFYLICAATRLARFNVQTRVVDSRYFVGLPAPAAAGGVASFLFFAPDAEWRTWAALACVIIVGLLGVLMISTFRYASFKQVDLRRRWSYRVAVPLAAMLLLVIYHPPAFFISVALIYTVSGPALWMTSRLGPRSEVQPAPSED